MVGANMAFRGAICECFLGAMLVGDGLGNFHVDFPMDGAVTEIYGLESLFLGKFIRWMALAFLRRGTLTSRGNYLSLSLYIYIYIYMYL